MQFVKDGPDIPDRLVQLHEEGKVVFFCGAGISYPAGLPGFGGLVDGLVKELGVTPDKVQQSAIDLKQFDTAIGLLESGIVGGREMLRTKLVEILTPGKITRKELRTHEALLTLGRCRNGKLRLITTNFDRLFEEVIRRDNLKVETFKAPFLPVPKSRWDGLVYLHGLIEASPAPASLSNLVVSSGDFGLAYLTERWASRFVTELFRGYSVCFVGYSISDPVLRYMMDALAADRMLGESPPEMFAFGDSPKGKDEKAAIEWRAKNVTPILYRGTPAHQILHQSLRAWAGVYRDGASGKERIVVTHAIGLPAASTMQDDFVGRVLWALSDPNGIPAKRFADLDPAPPFEWLEALCDNRFRHSDLGRFGIPADAKSGKDIEYSLVHRPTPYCRAPWTSLFDTNRHGVPWDAVMTHVARWLTRHLNDPRLILWIAERRNHPCERFLRMIGNTLGEITRLERDGETEELQRRKAGAPNAIPLPNMRTLWRMVLSGRTRRPADSYQLNDWLHRFGREGLTPSLRLELRGMLEPRILFKKPFHWPGFERGEAEPEEIKDLVHWELVFASEHTRSALGDCFLAPKWASALMEMLPDFTTLLKDSFDLMAELGAADRLSDHSYHQYYSVSGGYNHLERDGWPVLVDLCRDGWLELTKRSVRQAGVVAKQWRDMPYPIFKRLAFFAAANAECVEESEISEWLLADDGHWLWSPETRRETIRLLVAVSGRPGWQQVKGAVESALLSGPPGEIFNPDRSPEELAHATDRAIWLRLAKINHAGPNLGVEANEWLEDASRRYPEWRLAEDEGDEYPIWLEPIMSFEQPDFRAFLNIPARRKDLVGWLKDNPGKPNGWEDDGWREYCRRRYATAACALYCLASEGVWPTDRIEVAIQVWSDARYASRVWRRGGPITATMPTPVLTKLSDCVGYWLDASAKSLDCHNEAFITLCRRVVELEYETTEPSNDPVFEAINHPVGNAVEALMKGWYRKLENPAKAAGEAELAVFTRICRRDVGVFRHGRVILAVHTISLFRMDSLWARKNLVPLFDWKKSKVEARGAWTGFLGSPRIFRPLLELLREPLLDTVQHYGELGRYGEQYAALLTIAALDGGIYTNEEFRAAFSQLPTDGLESVARLLVQFVESAGDQRCEFWDNRCLQFLKQIWPKTREALSSGVSDQMALLCIAAGERFPAALKELKPWLVNNYTLFYAVHRLKEGDLCRRFPVEALDFLDMIVRDDTSRPKGDLGKCVSEILEQQPDLATDRRVIRLREFVAG